MKEKANNFARYTTAAAALLAVSGGATAGIVSGAITSNGSDNTLRNNGDEVYIDINNDGVDDFLGVVYGSGSYKSFYFGSYAPGNMVERSYNPFLKKFSLNDVIGSFSNSSNYGLISVYSPGSVPSPPPAPLAPFNPQNDNGFIGVSTIDGGELKYGWVQVQINEEGDEVSFLSCAMEETSEQPILAGNGVTVPLLPIASAAGLGLIGLFAAMKKRKKLTA